MYLLNVQITTSLIFSKRCFFYITNTSMRFGKGKNKYLLKYALWYHNFVHLVKYAFRQP